jgi:hypothetical protein
MSFPVFGVIAALVLIVVIWFAFVAPSERRYHERKLKIVQDRIARRRETVNEEQSGQQDKADEAKRQ